MTEIIGVELADGGMLYVEAAPIGRAEGGPGAGGPGESGPGGGGPGEDGPVGDGSAAGGTGDLEGRFEDRLPDLSGVTAALSSFARQIGDALHRAAPDRATVEFGCQLGLQSGRLTALVVQGSASANLRVTLAWDKG
ncbi:CU044_2847 family protein [Streptomyces sp. NPDC101160]|uniref:CU044_2847 family protein n=1 Tax=Streptomyces sp. NPDC101160 TaxID=3366118 RepID=UPI0037F4FA7A